LRICPEAVFADEDDDIAPSRVRTWKKDLEDHMPSIFERKNAADESAEKRERRTSHLERKIGQLVIEKEFLEKKCDPLAENVSFVLLRGIWDSRLRISDLASVNAHCCLCRFF